VSKTEEITCYVADRVSLSGLHAFPSVPSALDWVSGHHCGIFCHLDGFYQNKLLCCIIQREVLVGLYFPPTSLDETG
jgi:hypothetical protein